MLVLETDISTPLVIYWQIKMRENDSIKSYLKIILSNGNRQDNKDRQYKLSRKVEDKKKKALFTGINGQDGSYLAEFLLEKGLFIVK